MNLSLDRKTAPLRVLALLITLAHTPLATAESLATINGDTITQEDVDREDAAPKAGSAPRELKPKDTLARLVERVLFAQAAVKNGVLDQPELRAALDRRLPFPREQTYLPGMPYSDSMTPQEKANTSAARAFLADIYIELRANSLPPISEEDIHSFYEKNPLLFSNRHVYTVKEIVIERPTSQAKALVQSHIQSTRSIDELAFALKRKNIDFKGAIGTRNAENMPMDMLEFLNGMKIARLYKSPKEPAGAIAVLSLERAIPAPMEEQQAAAAIAQYLLNQRRKVLMNTEAKELKERSLVVFMPGVTTE